MAKLWDRLDYVPARRAARLPRSAEGKARDREWLERQRREEPSEDAKAMVRSMSAYGYAIGHIMAVTGLKKSQLRYLKNDIRLAGIKKDIDVLDGAFLRAVGGPERDWEKIDGAANRFWLERRLGWVPPVSRNVSINVDLDNLSDQELLQLEGLMSKAQRRG